MRVKSFLSELVRSEQEKEAERHLQEGFNLVLFGYEAVIPSHEEAARLNPRHKPTLAVTYAGAGRERWMRSWSSITSTGGPEKLLRQVKRARLLYGSEAKLDEALGGPLQMYNEAMLADPTYPRAYSGCARVYREAADSLLIAYGIWPYRYLGFRESLLLVGEGESKLVQFAGANLGYSTRETLAHQEFADEILWLYKEAEMYYVEALERDPTDAQSYVDLAHVRWHLGKLEGAFNFHKALAILNKAIQADNGDGQSYFERAQIFEEQGEIELAISDLERVLTLSTSVLTIDTTREKIEKLRKGKQKYDSGIGEYLREK